MTRTYEVCGAAMTVTDRSPSGALTQYECPKGHVLFVDSTQKVIK